MKIQSVKLEVCYILFRKTTYERIFVVFVKLQFTTIQFLFDCLGSIRYFKLVVTPYTGDS